jgi:hypothetical protein
VSFGRPCPNMGMGLVLVVKGCVASDALGKHRKNVCRVGTVEILPDYGFERTECFCVDIELI